VTKLTTFFLILVALGLADCSKPRGAEYYPESRIGGRYEYVIEYQVPIFAFSVGGVQKATMVSRVDGKETINGKEYFRQVNTFSGIPGLDQQVYYSRWSTEGVYGIEDANKNGPEHLDTPFPVMVGSSWTSKQSTEPTRYQALGIETVETPEKIYKNCLKVSFAPEAKNIVNEATARATQYLAPNIGAIKIVMTANGVPMTFTLQKYK